MFQINPCRSVLQICGMAPQGIHTWCVFCSYVAANRVWCGKGLNLQRVFLPRARINPHNFPSSTIAWHFIHDSSRLCKYTIAASVSLSSVLFCRLQPIFTTLQKETQKEEAQSRSSYPQPKYMIARTLLPQRLNQKKRNTFVGVYRQDFWWCLAEKTKEKRKGIILLFSGRHVKGR